jgi:hypothetical protein
MKSLLLCLLLCLLVAGSALAQPNTLWTRHYGKPWVDWCTSMVTTSDNGFALGNYSVQDSGGVTLFSILKTNADGDSLWRKYYGMNIVSHCTYDLKQTADGGYILVGYAGQDPDQQSCALKTNAGGDSVWMQYYGGTANEIFQSVVQVSDGGYICAGSSNATGNWQTYLMKIDASGNTVWTRYYGDTNQQTGTCIIPTNDGNFMVGGYTLIPSPYGYSPFLLKVNANGDSLWQATYPSANAECKSIKQTNDGGYIMALQKFVSWQFDAAGMKVNANGVQEWITAVGGQQFDQVIQTADGNYVFIGNYSTMAPPQATYMAKFSATGTQVWTLQLELSTGLEWGMGIAQLPAGNLVIAGTDVVTGASNQMYLLKFDIEAAPPALDVTLTPINPPIVVRAQGGSFNFNISLQRTVAPQAPYTVWARIKNPDGTYTAPTLGPVTINTPVGVTITRQRSQTVPGTWPSGLYSYLGYANNSYSYPAIDSSSFTWTKSTTADGGPSVWEATCTGEPFPGELAVSVAESFSLMSASPNPFNPATTISYSLPEAGRVRLQVFDTAGRLVATLADGWREAGLQEVTFDGSNLASGLYLYRINVAQQSLTGKICLMK